MQKYTDSISGLEDTLKKETATHSSILVWETHGQRSLVGYSSWGPKRVGHNLVTKQHDNKINIYGLPLVIWYLTMEWLEHTDGDPGVWEPCRGGSWGVDSVLVGLHWAGTLPEPARLCFYRNWLTLGRTVHPGSARSQMSM